MKYCIPFHNSCEYLQQVDEISIKYKRAADAFIDFLNDHKKQRVIVICDNFDLEEEDINLFSNLVKKDYNNFVIRFYFKGTESKFLVDRLKDANVPFFFSNYCVDFDMIQAFISCGVSDIYIVNELGFSLIDISKIAKENNVLIRVFPNVAQASFNYGNEISRFFIRPEDIHYYEDYVDICEIFGDEGPRVDTLYKIYAIDKRWDSLLKFIISNIEVNILNPFLTETFVQYRLYCKKKCVKGKKCTICDKYLRVATGLTEIHNKKMNSN